MQLRIAHYHHVDEFEELLGLKRPGPGRTGGKASRWRVPPGDYPSAYGHEEWGEEGILSLLWDPSRPVVWDTDLPTHDNPGRTCAVLASGVLVQEEDRQWRYYVPPGGDPMLLAGVIRFRGKQKTMSILGRAAERFPAVVLFEDARAWLTGGAPTRRRAGELPPVQRDWFRSWPIRPPDVAESDDEGVIRLC